MGWGRSTDVKLTLSSTDASILLTKILEKAYGVLGWVCSPRSATNSRIQGSSVIDVDSSSWCDDPSRSQSSSRRVTCKFSFVLKDCLFIRVRYIPDRPLVHFLCKLLSQMNGLLDPLWSKWCTWAKEMKTNSTGFTNNPPSTQVRIHTRGDRCVSSLLQQWRRRWIRHCNVDASSEDAKNATMLIFSPSGLLSSRLVQMSNV